LTKKNKQADNKKPIILLFD